MVHLPHDMIDLRIKGIEYKNQVAGILTWNEQ